MFVFWVQVSAGSVNTQTEHTRSQEAKHSVEMSTTVTATGTGTSAPTMATTGVQGIYAVIATVKPF